MRVTEFISKMQKIHNVKDMICLLNTISCNSIHPLIVFDRKTGNPKSLQHLKATAINIFYNQQKNISLQHSHILDFKSQPTTAVSQVARNDKQRLIYFKQQIYDPNLFFDCNGAPFTT
jgi:hypothetical protein